jgi:NADPH-dependent F420 reductase
LTAVGFLGGTGELGMALSLQFSKTHQVYLGSRSVEKATAAINTIRQEKGPRDYLQSQLIPVDNEEAVRKSDVILITVPHESAVETVQNLAHTFRQGQIVISAVAAVTKSGEDFVADFVSGKSYVEKIREILPPAVGLAAAFQTVPANILYKEKEISADVLVAADDFSVFERAASLINDIQGLRPLYLGSLKLSGEVERLTALLLNVGKRNKLKSPTLKFPSF